MESMKEGLRCVALVAVNYGIGAGAGGRKYTLASQGLKSCNAAPNTNSSNCMRL